MKKFLATFTAIAIVCVSQYTPHAQMLHMGPCTKGDMGRIENSKDFYFYPSVAGNKREWLGAKVKKELPTVVVHLEDKK